MQPVPPSSHAAASGRNRTLLVVAGAAVLLVLIVAGVWAFLLPGDGTDTAGDGGQSSDTEQTEPADETADTVDITVADYLNRPPAQVRTELEQLGFEVTIEGTGAFTVDVTPNGPVEPETSIVVKASNTRAPDTGDTPSQPGDGGSDPGNGGRDCTPATIGCKP